GRLLVMRECPFCMGRINIRLQCSRDLAALGVCFICEKYLKYGEKRPPDAGRGLRSSIPLTFVNHR
ncbi:hypothetical protein ACCS96_47305, partial [Rhizobium ruizarguesonis]